MLDTHPIIYVETDEFSFIQIMLLAVIVAKQMLGT